jgi:hypothetical protein
MPVIPVDRVVDKKNMNKWRAKEKRAVAEALPLFLGLKWNPALLDCILSFHDQLCFVHRYSHMSS